MIKREDFQVRRKKFSFAIILIVMLLTIVACSNTNNASPEPSQPAQPAQPAQPEVAEPEVFQPVTLKVVRPPFLANQFDNIFVPLVQEKYPHITFDIHNAALHNPTQVEQMIAGGFRPDLVLNAITLTDHSVNIGFTEDMSPLIEKFNVDLSIFDEQGFDTIRTYSQRDEIFALPFMIGAQALIYNKDIFDKFAVGYPKDGMTWDDVVDLAAKVTGAKDGVNYIGLHPEGLFRAASQLSLPFADPVTKKALVNTEPYRTSYSKLYELFARIYSIPGSELLLGPAGNEAIYNDERVAMWIAGSGELTRARSSDINFDMVSMPYFPENPFAAWGYVNHVGHVTPWSEHKDDAFRAITVMFSDVAQKKLAAEGNVPAVKTDEILAEYAKNVEGASEKNINSLFLTTGALPHTPISPWDNHIRIQIMTLGAMRKIVEGNMDINTVLNEAEEEINLYISNNPVD